MQAYSRFAPLVLRVGLAGVILWFGVNQLLFTEQWTAWVPEWTATFGFSPEQIVGLNGFFEVATGLMLLVGLYTRYVALVLFLHLLVIVYDIGLTAIGVRDLGLAAALLALALDDRSVYALSR
jgi:uncharacterized membrane protein YphA (DoxX/SURF4 family)